MKDEFTTGASATAFKNAIKKEGPSKYYDTAKTAAANAKTAFDTCIKGAAKSGTDIVLTEDCSSKLNTWAID